MEKVREGESKVGTEMESGSRAKVIDLFRISILDSP
jgi:hypothetical protein